MSVTISFQPSGTKGFGNNGPAMVNLKTILVVDDYPSLCEMTASMLRPVGYRILTASSAVQATKIARENLIDLLITDVEMPEMRGDELADWFQVNSPKTHIIFVSAICDAESLSPEISLLRKPFSADALIAQVQRSLR